MPMRQPNFSVMVQRTSEMVSSTRRVHMNRCINSVAPTRFTLCVSMSEMYIIDHFWFTGWILNSRGVLISRNVQTRPRSYLPALRRLDVIHTTQGSGLGWGEGVFSSPSPQSFTSHFIYSHFNSLKNLFNFSSVKILSLIRETNSFSLCQSRTSYPRTFSDPVYKRKQLKWSIFVTYWVYAGCLTMPGAIDVWWKMWEMCRAIDAGCVTW